LGKAPELIQRAGKLSDASGRPCQRQRYRLIELLDPEVTHYEFFLGRPPITKIDWSDDNALLQAIPELNPCTDGFPSQVLFNYDYQVVNLSPAEFEFLQKCDGNSTVTNILSTVQISLDEVRNLIKQQLIILTPA
jgi:hypothetical protein